MPEVRKLSLYMTFIVMFGLLFAGCQILPQEEVDAPPELAEPPQPRTVFYEVERGDIAETVTGLARVAAQKEETLYFKQGGRVGEIFVEYYEWVEEGQPLARLEARDLEYRHQLAYLDLKREEMRLERERDLVGLEGGISRYDWELRQIDYEKAKMHFDRLDEELNEITIRAPFEGKVTAISMQEGNIVEEYTGVITIADPSDLVLHMNASARDLRRIDEGMRAEVYLDNLGTWVHAEVAELPGPGAEMAPGTPDRRVRIALSSPEELIVEEDEAVLEEEELELDNDDEIFEEAEQLGSEEGLSEDELTGEDPEEIERELEEIEDPHELLQFDTLLRTAIYIKESKDTLLLPRAAVREFQDRTFVRIEENGARKEIDIEVGLETRTRIEILDGLEEGQKVIGR